MSPTIFRHRNYRFFFFFREEPRLHVHLISPDGEAKFWIDPEVEVAANKGLKPPAINELQEIIKERQDEFREHWHRHFQS
ncbi:MAG: DUF4160 domain-containing protein [Phycisphaerae bacterium]|nr:DUF4160 domain-containing protein [Phycisphaerae bacterium]